jgi:nucleoside-diphosphate-sugar epimerase
VNVDGTKNLFNAISKRTKHFVYISGVSVFEPNDQKERIVNEESRRNPDTEYLRLRLEAEDYLRENCSRQGIELTVIYFPEIVYGNGGSFKTYFLEKIKVGKFRVPGNGQYITNFIHLDDAVDILITAAVRRNDTANQSYIASFPQPAPFRNFVNFIAGQFRVRNPGSVPLSLARIAVGTDLINMLTKNNMASNEKIRKIYHFKYSSYEVGIPGVVSEYNSTTSTT